MRLYLLLIISLNVSQTQAQYAPAAGLAGSTAIAYNSNQIIDWATACEIKRGWQQIDDTLLGKTTVGSYMSAIGSYDSEVVSLGDGGEAILQFTHPISNKDGFDFVVFENAFSTNFLELAHVEVSTDGINYVRFCSHSLTQDTLQTDTFGDSEPELLHNIAGKYKSGFGTPFDLDELKYENTIDISAIKFVKVIDVIGTINADYASFDCYFNSINDPYPTPFASGGFDLEAVGVINNDNYNTTIVDETMVEYVHTTNDEIQVKTNVLARLQVFDATGKLLKLSSDNTNHAVQINPTNQLLLLHLTYKNKLKIIKIIH